MLFDPRRATGPNATGLGQPGIGPSAEEKAFTAPRKDRKNAQDIPGINKVPSGQGKEWERKQRAREYRVAARREKRNRKADEKKQRKLNATILRRMTRNPDKYNKNAERNRLRAIQGERQAIWMGAVRQAERLAAEHDPSGATFNVGPVIKQEDGTVISVETLKRREEGKARRLAEAAANEAAATNGTEVKMEDASPITNENSTNGINPEHYVQMELDKKIAPRGISKNQQKKLEALKPRPPPPKPHIPEGYSIPEGEENFVALWDLSDTELERRVLREKRRKAAARKALRQKQQSGKAERRMARDEKRRVYRDIKLSWKSIKEEEVRECTRYKAQEDEEGKKIAVEVAEVERARAMEHCASLGFTLDNTEGVDEVKPRALGMKGVEVDWDAIEADEKPGTIRLKNPAKERPKNPKRVDLGVIPGNAQSFVPSSRTRSAGEENSKMEAEEFIKLDVGSEHQFQELSYNHKVRRKLRRALDNVQIAKETLVRERAIAHYTSQDLPIPPILQTPYKPENKRGSRILENGTLETAKQERVRARLELAEYNKIMKVLRRQAKQTAVEAGLRKHAEVTGRIEVVRTPEELAAEKKREEEARLKARELQFNNGPARIVGDDYGLGYSEDSDIVMEDPDADGDVRMGSDSDDSSDDSD